MSRFPLTYPPGCYLNGTDFQTNGRYADAWLVRWYGASPTGATLGNIGGWTTRGTGTVTGTVTGAARAILPWMDNTGNTWLAVGTHSNLYVSNRGGTIYDITPTGFTVGRVDASAAGGYGSGLYGKGTYGTPRPDSSLVLDATQWTLDTYGQYLVGINPDDGYLYKWTLSTSTKAAKNTAAPKGTAVVCTDEGFIFLLGTTDPRTLSWCDQRDDTDWTPSPTNQAGDFTLQTPGRLLCGKTVQGATLLLTDQDCWAAVYEPTTLVYGFDKKGDACGGISRQCMVPFNMQAAWMSPSGFWLYNGYVQPIPCDVQDYVFKDINLLQASKIFGSHISQYSEIEWRYCSAGSNEIDRCVVWNYKDHYWIIGRIPRLCAADKRAGFQYPVAVDAGGLIYNHECGFGYDGSQPYATAGRLMMGQGDNVMNVMGLYPDDLTVGNVTATFNVKNNPDDQYSTFGPYTLASQTDLRFVGRQIETTFTGTTMSAWRVGVPALDVSQGGGR